MVRPVAASGHVDVVRAVDDAVQDRLGHDRVREQRVPVLGGPVRGDDQAPPDPFADEFVKVVGLGGRELAHCEVIEDEQRRASPPAQSGLPAAIRVPAREIGEQPGCFGKRDAVTVPAGGVTEGLGDHGFAHADSDGDRLQQLRGLLPCDVLVVAETHPLRGERLAALSFRRKRGELLLVVVLPDGTPGMIGAAATDVFGARPEPERGPTPLSVEGVRILRVLIETHRARMRARQRPRPWKVVRHKHGVDPFHRAVCVYSAHTTESAARRARDREKAAMVRAAGYEVAAAWEWSVVQDPAGLLAVTSATHAHTAKDDRR